MLVTVERQRPVIPESRRLHDRRRRRQGAREAAEAESPHRINTNEAR